MFVNLGAGDSLRGSALGVIDQMGGGGVTKNEEIFRKGKEEFERGMGHWKGEHPTKLGISLLKLQDKVIKLVQAWLGKLQLRIRLPRTERRALPLHMDPRAVLHNTDLRALTRHTVHRTLARNTEPRARPLHMVLRALPLRPTVDKAQLTVMVSRGL